MLPKCDARNCPEWNLVGKRAGICKRNRQKWNLVGKKAGICRRNQLGMAKASRRRLLPNPQGRQSFPFHSSPKAEAHTRLIPHPRQAVVVHAATPCAGSFPAPSAPKAGGRRRRGGYPQQPTAAAAGYRQPPGLLRRAAVTIVPHANSRANNRQPEPPRHWPPCRCQYPSQTGATPVNTHFYYSPKTDASLHG